jgi:hypothetical protein
MGARTWLYGLRRLSASRGQPQLLKLRTWHVRATRYHETISEHLGGNHVTFTRHLQVLLKIWNGAPPSPVFGKPSFIGTFLGFDSVLVDCIPLTKRQVIRSTL